MKKFLKGPGFIVILVALVLILSLSVSGSSNNNKPLTYTELLELIQNDEVASIATVDGTVVVYGVKTDSKFLERFPDKYDFIASIPSVDIFYEDVIKITAEKKGVSTEQISSSDFTFKMLPLEPASYPWWVSLIPYVLLIVVVIISMSFIKRQMGDAGGNAKAMNFSKSREAEKALLAR